MGSVEKRRTVTYTCCAYAWIADQEVAVRRPRDTHKSRRHDRCCTLSILRVKCIMRVLREDWCAAAPPCVMAHMGAGARREDVSPDGRELVGGG